MLADDGDQLSLSGNTCFSSNYNAVQKDEFCIDADGDEYRMEWWEEWKDMKHMCFAWFSFLKECIK